MKYRYLGNSGLLVSRMCLGTMTFGAENWGCDLVEAVQITNRFIDGGGNFIDTADSYGNGMSEEMLGKAIRDHRRDDLVLASKCYFRARSTANAKGLSRKHIVESCEASLQRLATDFLDLYQIHGPDPYTPVEETMKSLDQLIRRGMVRYVGCSNLFAWQIVKANGISARYGYEQLCSGQYMYNLIRRDVEREILPACEDQGMGLICWAPLASGLLTGKYPRQDRPDQGTRMAHRANVDLPRYWNDNGFKVADAVREAAERLDKTPAQVALGWLLADRRVTAVIVGARTASQVAENLAVGDWDLPQDLQQHLADVVPFEHGYPLEWMNKTYDSTFGGAEFPPQRYSPLTGS